MQTIHAGGNMKFYVKNVFMNALLFVVLSVFESAFCDAKTDSSKFSILYQLDGESISNSSNKLSNNMYSVIYKKWSDKWLKFGIEYDIKTSNEEIIGERFIYEEHTMVYDIKKKNSDQIYKIHLQFLMSKYICQRMNFIYGLGAFYGIDFRKYEYKVRLKYHDTYSTMSTSKFTSNSLGANIIFGFVTELRENLNLYLEIDHMFEYSMNDDHYEDGKKGQYTEMQFRVTPVKFGVMINL